MCARGGQGSLRIGHGLLYYMRCGNRASQRRYRDCWAQHTNIPGRTPEGVLTVLLNLHFLRKSPLVTTLVYN